MPGGPVSCNCYQKKTVFPTFLPAGPAASAEQRRRARGVERETGLYGHERARLVLDKAPVLILNLNIAAVRLRAASIRFTRAPASRLAMTRSSPFLEMLGTCCHRTPVKSRQEHRGTPCRAACLQRIGWSAEVEKKRQLLPFEHRPEERAGQPARDRMNPAGAADASRRHGPRKAAGMEWKGFQRMLRNRPGRR